MDKEEDGGSPAEVLHVVGPFEFLTFQTGSLLLKLKKKKTQTVALTTKYVIHCFMLSWFF